MPLAVALDRSVRGTSARVEMVSSELVPRLDRLAVQRDDAIARLEARLPAGMPGRTSPITGGR